MHISNVELTLLELLAEFEELSGYEINGLIDHRGFRNWAGIGSTSIYQGLKKLETKQWVQSRIATEKTGKGPLPRFFSITENGWEQLRANLREAIRDAGSNNDRFPLALAGLIWLDRDELAPLMEERIDGLKERLKSVQNRIESEGGSKLPFHVRELFRHSILHLETEIHFCMEIIDKLEENHHA